MFRRNKDVTLEKFLDTAMKFRDSLLVVPLRCGCMNDYCKGWRIVRKDDMDLEPSDITMPIDVQGPLERPPYYDFTKALMKL